MIRRLLTVPLVCLALMSLGLGQGLFPVGSKDDWEEINFEFDSHILTDGFPSLLRLAELLNRNPEYRVKLVGHADYFGSYEYNDKLGLRRANAVRDFLIKYGARPEQITVESRGERQPKVDLKTREARFINRRVEITVTDAQGRVISAGGIGDAIEALQKLAKQQEECCKEILAKLDKLDQILEELRALRAENQRLRQDLDALKAAQAGLKKEVEAIPREPAPPRKEELAKVAEEAAQKVIAQQPSRFSLLGLNLGSDDAGHLTFTGKGRYFAPFNDHFALQAEAEYLSFSGRKEGQFDIGIVNRYKSFQLGLFSSFKRVDFSQYRQGGTLGQASLTADYLFNRGRVGLFGAKGFMTKALLHSSQLGPNLIENIYARTVDQIGGSTAVALWGRNWLEANLGYLRSRVYEDKPGGTIRFVFPFAERWAFTLEGGFNETLIGPSSTGRVVAGIRFGNFLSPRRFGEIKHPVPADIPRVRFELVTERLRTGNDAPVANAGPDLIGVPAGEIRLDGSASYDPDGDPITFQWTQVAGPPVNLQGANTPVATFVAAAGQVYGFRLTVTDSHGLKGVDSVTVATKEIPRVQILRFDATPAQINRGQTSILSWQVANADEVVIEGIGRVERETGTRQVSPAETTIYTLIARNAVSEVRATVAVVVEKPLPSFVRCDATPATITEGESARIVWETQNAEQVTLSGIGAVALTGWQLVSPTTTTTYMLTATNANGSISCPVTIQVSRGAVPRILNFTASPLEVLAGTPTTLSWQVEGADAVEISGIGAVDLRTGTAEVRPTDTTTYTLRARNRFGEVSASVTVNVIQPVRIVSFVAEPAELTEPNQPFRLSWVTENATSVIISHSLGPRPTSGSVVLRVPEDTTFTLIASNKLSQAVATVTVRVVRPTPGPPAGQPPVADAGPDFETWFRDLTLDGSRSFDPDGGPLTYEWRSIGNRAAVLDPHSAITRVQLGAQSGVYEFELRVTDQTGQTAVDIVRVNFRSTTMR